MNLIVLFYIECIELYTLTVHMLLVWNTDEIFIPQLHR